MYLGQAQTYSFTGSDPAPTDYGATNDPLNLGPNTYGVPSLSDLQYSAPQWNSSSGMGAWIQANPYLFGGITLALAILLGSRK